MGRKPRVKTNDKIILPIQDLVSKTGTVRESTEIPPHTAKVLLKEQEKREGKTRVLSDKQKLQIASLIAMNREKKRLRLEEEAKTKEEEDKKAKEELETIGVPEKIEVVVKAKRPYKKKIKHNEERRSELIAEPSLVERVKPEPSKSIDIPKPVIEIPKVEESRAIVTEPRPPGNKYSSVFAFW